MARRVGIFILDVISRCKTCKNLKLAKDRAFCMKMPSDSDKSKPRDISKHISDKLFAARCNKYDPAGAKAKAEFKAMKEAKAEAKLLSIRA